MTQQFLIYQSEDGRTHIQVALDADTLWLNQKQLTALFGKAKGTISEHIKHVFEDGELEENSVVRYFRTTGLDAKTYNVAHYNLEMVLALGFRVRSSVAVRFRQWANRSVRPELVEGQSRNSADEVLRNLQTHQSKLEVACQRVVSAVDALHFDPSSGLGRTVLLFWLQNIHAPQHPTELFA